MNNQPRKREIQQIDLLKWGLGCSGVAMMVCTGIIMFTLIVMPVIFRNLDPEDQAKIVRRLPIMGTFQPTREFADFLPTISVASNSDEALKLLTTVPENTVTPDQSGALSAGGNVTPLVAASPTAAQLASVPTGTATTVPPTATNLPPTNAPNTTGATQVLLIPTTLLVPSATAQPVTEVPTTIPATIPPTVIPTSAPTLTFTPTLEPTSVPPPTLAPTATLIPAPFSYHSEGYKWIPQSWNNCGPANLVQVLNAMGWPGNQAEAATYLKPTKNDKNVSPWEMVTYVNDYVGPPLGLKALMRYAGNLDTIKRLSSQNFGVILETGYDVVNDGWMGHYLTVLGYDDAKSVVYGLDTYLGDGPDSLGFREDYTDLDRRWGHFNRLYIVVYPASRESEVAAILGPDADSNYNAQHALNVAKAEASAQPGQPYAWFNIGTSYVLMRQYKQAAVAFDQAWSVGGLPFRMLWYQFTPYEAYYYSGNFKNVLALANTSLRTTIDVEETYFWRGMAAAALGQTQQAVSDLKHAVNYNHNFTLAYNMLVQIEGGTFAPPVIGQGK